MVRCWTFVSAPEKDVSIETRSAHLPWIWKNYWYPTCSHQSPSRLILCHRCRLRPEGGEHHSRELVYGGSGAWRTSSFSGFVNNTAAHTNFTNTDAQAHAFIQRECCIWCMVPNVLTCPQWDSWLIKQWNTRHAFWYTNSAAPMHFSELLNICCFYWSNAPAVHIFRWVKAVSLFNFFAGSHTCPQYGVVFQTGSASL